MRVGAHTHIGLLYIHTVIVVLGIKAFDEESSVLDPLTSYRVRVKRKVGKNKSRAAGGLTKHEGKTGM